MKYLIKSNLLNFLNFISNYFTNKKTIFNFILIVNETKFIKINKMAENT